jgi:hypothetical protein
MAVFKPGIGATFAGAVTITTGGLMLSAFYAKIASYDGATPYALLAGAAGSDYGGVGYNAVPTAVSGVYNYGATDVASRLEFYNGGFRWYTAPSGTAGSPITLTQRMSLTASLLTVAVATTISSTLTVADTLFHRTTSTLANGAAAQTGTLTNAPVAGNPTKWLQVDDNGTTRYVPAW